jgi:hypothetical protein
VATDEDGLYRHHIHSANPIQQLDIVHTGERWGIFGAAAGLVLGLLAHFTVPLLGAAVPGLPADGPSLVFTVLLFTVFGGALGIWLGGAVGASRESYKLAPFHDEIEDGRLLIMVDVRRDSAGKVRQIMTMGFPRVRYCGRDSTFINPFKRPARIHAPIH